MAKSLARMAIIALTAVLLLIATASLIGYRIWVQHAQHDAQRVPAFAGQVLAQQIVDYVRVWTQATRSIAQAPLTLRLLQSKDEAERGERLAEIRSLHPELEQIQILGADQARGALPLSSALSAWELLTIQTRKSGLAADTALHAEAPRLTLIEPVQDKNHDTAGYVLVSRQFREIEQLLGSSPLVSGYVELQQANGHTDTLFKRGDEQLKAQVAPTVLPLAGTPWRLVHWRLPSPRGLVSNPLNAWLALAGVLSLLIATVFGMTYLQARSALRRDLAALTKLLSDLTHNRMRKSYAVQLKELQGGYHVMYQLGRLMIGKQLRIMNTAETDHLSQVNNRRSFEAKQREVFARVNEGWAHSLLILDIDNFKQVNDTYGHEAGDQLIVQFGQALKKNLRGSDFVARLGGDEFCVIFPNTPLPKANELAQRLREQMPRQLELLPNVRHAVSWSGGLSEYSRRDQSENAALARADQALLDAKRNGRNRTETQLAA